MPYGDDPTEAPKVSREQIADFWKAKGAPEHVALGIADRVVGVESGGKPTIVNKDSGAEGLYQHLGERKSKLEALPHWQSPQVQNEFAYSEVTGGDKIATEGWDKIKAAKTRQEASELWNKYFERAGGGYGRDPVIGKGKWNVSPDAIAYEQGRNNSDVVYMSPDDYLAMTPQIEAGADNRTKRRSLMKSLGLGDDIEAIPTLDVKSEGGRAKVYDQDGRNRALVAKEQGVDLIPVAIHGGVKGLKEIEGMTGTVKPFDFKPVPTVTRETTPPTTALGQFASGARTALEGAEQFIQHTLPAFPGFGEARGRALERQDLETAARLKALEAAGTTRSLPYVAGEVAATLPTAAIAPAMGAGVGGTMLAGAAAGALGGLAHPVSDPSRFAAEKAEQAGIGGLLGAGTAGLGRVVGNALAPTILPAAQRLLDRGINLLPGQVTGGARKGLEQISTSVPFSGLAVQRAMGRVNEDFNRAVYDEVLAPIGQKFAGKEIGYEGIDQLEKQLSKEFDRVKGLIDLKPDATMNRELLSLAALAKEMPASEYGQLKAIVNNRVAKRFGSGPQKIMDGTTFKQVESELSQISRNIWKDMNSSAGQKQLASAVDEVNAIMRDALERQNPHARAELQKINEAWAKFVRVRDAAANRGSSLGIFTPNDLLTAEKRDSGSRLFARGKGPLQQLAADAQQVFGSRMPDSHTAPRLATLAEAGELGGLLFHNPLAAAAQVAAHGLHAAAYSSPGVNLLRSVTATGFPKTRNALAGVARAGGVAAAPAAGILAPSLVP